MDNNKMLQNDDPIANDDLIVVGIGASAGGLEALQDFFKNMPMNSGLAFVVVQHLSPDYKSLMNELLARQTDIPIHIAKDGMEIEGDRIYLIPPRHNIKIFHNKLFLHDQGSKKSLNLPVDIFFRSLAQEKGSQAIGIILSGTGSDGTLGTKAIKEAGGMMMVQDERSAKFDGMPRSSIATGLVDFILPPKKMPGALVEFIKHPMIKEKNALAKLLSENVDSLTKILILIREFSGNDYSYYKENTIIRRLERRMSINRLNNLDEYLDFLAESNKEKETLNRELLIGVTRFFRDQEAFDLIYEKVLPVITKKRTLRIWSVGCSTGEEVYSLAIILNEFLEKNHLDCEVKIFATDIDRQSIEYASKSFYQDSIVADVDPLYLTKYFKRLENGYQVCEPIRRNIVFAAHNLLRDSHFSKIDLLVCRNLFIYFKPEVQTRLLNMFYHSLSPEGFLFMGSSETLGEMSEAFSCIDAKWKIFRSRPSYQPNIMKNLPLIRSSASEIEQRLHRRAPSEEVLQVQRIMDGIIAAFLPPSILVDEDDNIVHIVNDISDFVKLSPGRFSNNLFNKLSQELSLFVSTMLRRLKKEEEAIVYENLISLKEYPSKKISIQGRRISSNGKGYYLLSFISKEEQESEEMPAYKPDIAECYHGKISELEKELQFTRESLQATVEELETSNEELQSSNEELIASNEELQSTNEELQSVNEELYTVNSEYQIKIDELTNLNNDINNLIKNTEIGALYLDRNLCIRKITPIVSQITNILPSDIGRPISHITLPNIQEELMACINKSVDDLQPIDREFVLENNRAYLTRIRPYRADYNAVDGILITFVDIRVP